MSDNGTSPYEVDLPQGGTLRLQSADEVVLWNNTAQRYIEDYGLQKANDLVLLSAILSQGLAMYRAQIQLADQTKAAEAASRIGKCAEEIRNLEKALGIDKKTREAGGQHDVKDYVSRLKRAAHLKGVRISERVKEIEKVMMEASWKIRLLRNGDAEDKSYHDISEKSIIDWLERAIAEIHANDQKWAREKGKVFIGKL